MRSCVHNAKRISACIFGLWLSFTIPGCGQGSGSPDVHAGPEVDEDQTQLLDSDDSGYLTPFENCETAKTAPRINLPHGLLTAQRLALPIVPPMGAGHLADFVVFEEKIYVANSFDGIATFEWTNEGTLEVLASQVLGTIRPRCNSLAVHEGSRTLYCASPDNLGAQMMGLSNHDPMVSSFRLSSLGTPSVHKAPALRAPQLHARSLVVAGDELYLALFDKGLWRADIDEEGGLSELTNSGLIADFRYLATYENKLIALTADRGLLVLERASESAPWFIVQEFALNGPALGLTVKGDEALVSMGSAGLSIFDLSQEPISLEYSLHPPAVIVSADRHQDRVAAIGLSGTYLYDMSLSPPGIIGSRRAKRVMLWGRFMSGDLVVSDWEFLTRYTADTSGRVFTPDASQGYYLSPGHPASVKLRNPGTFPLKMMGVIQEKGLFEIELAPGEEQVVTLSAESLSKFIHPLWNEADLDILSCPATEEDFSLEGVSLYRAKTQVVIIQRDPTTPPKQGHPGEGDLFPTVGLATEQGVDQQLPRIGYPELVVFHEQDCAAMWPELEDLAWLHSQELVPSDAKPMLISIVESNRNNFLDRWKLHDLRHGYTGGHLGIQISEDVQKTNSAFGALVYDDGFMGTLPGGAKHPTDYLIDENGRVLSVQRNYMGRYSF